MLLHRLLSPSPNSCVALLCLLLAAPAMAHQVQISGDVGGTKHIEPNDLPRAGEPSLTWFALTRRGGQVIPLAACRCELAVYAQPRRPGDEPLLRSQLRPIAADGYQDIPAADVTFPAVGVYDLVLQGQPAVPEDFQPFELTFAVTVAARAASPPSPAAASGDAAAAGQELDDPTEFMSDGGRSPIRLGIGLSILLVLVGGGVWALRRQRSGL